MKRGFRISICSGIPDSLSCITDFKPKILDSESKNFPDSTLPLTLQNRESRKQITERNSATGSQGNFRQTILTREGTVATALFSSRSCSIKNVEKSLKRATKHSAQRKSQRQTSRHHGGMPCSRVKEKNLLKFEETIPICIKPLNCYVLGHL